MHSRTVFGPCKIERRAARAPRRRAGAPGPAMVTFAVSLSFGASSAAMAGPTGGVVVQGQGSISTPSTSQTVVNQSSQQLTLNWSSFNVGSNESVRFYQPSSSSVAFNRILGQSASQIFGQIDANGQVVLINPNGLLIGRTAQLNVSSLVVSSLDAIDFNAASGRYRFSATRNNPGAVVNEGTITAQSGGSVTLLGGSVSNSGTIIADYGTVNLAAGRMATLDLAGDGLLRLQVGADLATNRDGVASAVENSGTVIADGGRVLLTASAVKNVFENLVNNTGIVRANRIDNSGGTIELLGPGGTVLSSGTLDASAGDAVSTGGSVAVLGDRVGLLGNAVVNVSGATGGGTALIGGDTHGSNPDVLDASQAYVSPGTTLNADAGETGDGGRVVVWSNDLTRYFGGLSARGGTLWGNGGFAEVSGKQSLEFNGAANLTAPHGVWGTLLLDPSDITIDGSNTATDTTTSSPFTPTNVYPSSANGADAVTIGSQVIEGLLHTGDVSLSATDNITLNSGVTIDARPAGASGAKLSLDAQNSIDINGQIFTNNGAISLQTDSTAGTGTSPGHISMGAGSALNAGTSGVTINAAGSVTLGSITAGQLVSVTAGAGSTIQNNADVAAISAPSLALTAGGSIGASGSGNAINTSAGSLSATATGGSVFVNTTSDVILSNVVASGAGNSANVTSGGSITIDSVHGDTGVNLTATSGTSSILDSGLGLGILVDSPSGTVNLAAAEGIGTVTNFTSFAGAPVRMQGMAGLTAVVNDPNGQINLSVLPAGVGMTLAAGAISLGNGAPASGSVIVQSPGALDASQFAAGAIQIGTGNTAQVALRAGTPLGSPNTLILSSSSTVTDQPAGTLLLSGSDINAGSTSLHTFSLSADDLVFDATAPTGDVVLNTNVSQLDVTLGGSRNLTVNPTASPAGTLTLDSVSVGGSLT
jgi:fibronectin-binding autotransporter adhesin